MPPKFKSKIDAKEPQNRQNFSYARGLLKIIFFGTPEFASETLRFLLGQPVEIVGIVTQPDRPQGRSSSPVFSPVKQLFSAQGLEIPLFQPEKSSDPEFLDKLQKLHADLFVVVAFGQILPQKLLDIPPLGSINVHASLLPKYRGAAPIQRCLIAGEKQTGVSIQKIVKQLDAGDVIATSPMAIPSDMTFGELKEALLELSKPLLAKVLHLFEKGIPPAESQDHSLATYASKIEPEEGRIDWRKPAEELHNLIRGFSPKPGARCWVESAGEKKLVKILRTKVVSRKGDPGECLKGDGVVVACGSHALELLEVQPESKKKMIASDWFRGFRSSLHFSLL